MTDHNTAVIINAADDLHLPTPETVTEARAFQAAASELLDSVKAEQAPDLNTATLKTLAKTHAAAVPTRTGPPVPPSGPLRSRGCRAY